MTVPVFTKYPSSASPTTFAADMDTMISEYPAYIAALNALGTDVGSDAADAAAQVVLAADQVALATTQAGLATTNGAAQVALATTQANNAAISATAAEGSALVAGAVVWVSGANYVLGDARYSPIDLQTYRRKVPGAGTTDPSLDSANWTPALDTRPSLQRDARTSDAVLGVADVGKMIDITSGTFTQTFAAVATLGDGWFCYLKNSGTGDITVDPNASELIDGLASYVMYPGESRLIQCDGLALRSVVLASFFRSFTSSGTFTKPPGYNVFGGLLWGGGGGGGKGIVGENTGGGGGGACLPFTLQASAIGATETVTIAAGGTARTTNGIGGIGGNSNFGVLLTSYGGGGGGGGDTGSFNGGAGGGVLGAGSSGLSSNTAHLGGAPISWLDTTTNADKHINQQFGGGGISSASKAGMSVYGGAGAASSVAGPPSLYGGGGGGGVDGANVAQTPGASSFGGAGGAGGNAVNGTVGTQPAGGGGATHTGASSGAGGAGQLNIWGVV